MSDFVVYPIKSALIEEAVRLAERTLEKDSSLMPVPALVIGVVELLWPFVPQLSAQTVVETLVSPAKLQAALDAHVERTTFLAMWADAFTASPDSRVDASRMPKRAA